MGALFDIDAALKHVFMLGPSFVMARATNGRAVREYLNVELASVLKRRVDVLALLAARRVSEFQRVLAHVEQIPEALRWRAWALLIVLSDLPELPLYVRLELERMDTRISMRDDGLLVHFRKKWTAEGRVEGLREGKCEGMLEGLRSGLRGVLEGKFGRIPGWASERIKAGNRVQLNRGSRKALTADSLERVLGPRALLK